MQPLASPKYLVRLSVPHPHSTHLPSHRQAAVQGAACQLCLFLVQFAAFGSSISVLVHHHSQFIWLIPRVYIADQSQVLAKLFHIC